MNSDKDHPAPPLSDKEYEVERESSAHAAARARESRPSRPAPVPDGDACPLYRSPACCCALALAFLAGVVAGRATARYCDWSH